MVIQDVNGHLPFAIDPRDWRVLASQRCRSGKLVIFGRKRDVIVCLRHGPEVRGELLHGADPHIILSSAAAILERAHISVYLGAVANQLSH